MTNLPVVCTLTPDTIATRKAGLLPGLVQRADSREEAADGIRSGFRPMACPQFSRPLRRNGSAAGSCVLISPSSRMVVRSGCR